MHKVAARSRSTFLGGRMRRPVHALSPVLVPTLLCLFALPTAWAAVKCVHPVTGAVLYTDGECAPGSTGRAVDLTPNEAQGEAADRPVHIRAAIAAHRPVVGMTRDELQRAMGQPGRVQAGVNGAEAREQWVYHRGGRSIHVELAQGQVTAVQTTEALPASRARTAAVAQAAPVKACPTTREIRDIEFEISKLENRERPQVLAELHRQLGEARRCTR